VSITFCKTHLIAYISLPPSKAQETDPNHQVATFGSSTGISNLRLHLVNIHLEEWTKSCADMGIPITAAIALNKLQGNETEITEHPMYSKEAFVDALVDFVVGNDLVSKINHILLWPF
jgi:hypothetical protein